MNRAKKTSADTIQKLSLEYQRLPNLQTISADMHDAEFERRTSLFRELTELIEAKEPKSEKTYLDHHKEKFCAYLLLTSNLTCDDIEKSHEWVCDDFRLPTPMFAEKELASLAVRIKKSQERNDLAYAAAQKWLLVPRSNGGPSEDQKVLVMQLLEKSPIVPEDIEEFMGKDWSQPLDSVKSLAKGINIKLENQKAEWRVVRSGGAYTIELTA